MRKFIFFVLLILGQLSLFGQNPCNIYFEAKNVTGTTVDIDVKADGFTNVYGFQMYLQWDSTVLLRNSITYKNPTLVGLDFGGTELGANILSSNWTETNLSNPNGQTLSNGSVIFTIRYNFSGDPCDETSLDLVNPPFRASLITYANETEFPINYDASDFQIPGNNCNGSQGTTGTGLIIDEVTASEGSTICLAIKVDSFKNVSSLQFKLKWDTSVISYTSWNNINGGQNAFVNVIGGDTLIFIMDAPDITLSDGSTLIEVCFLVVGNNGDMTPVEFIDSDFFEIYPTRPYYLDDGKVTIGIVSNPVTFTVKDTQHAPGDTVCVDILGKNFKDIESFQYIVKWDDSILKWNGLGPVNNISISDGSQGHINPYGTGALKISWNAPGGTSITRPDNSILYQLCYDILGDCNDETDIQIVGEPGFPIEVTSNEQAVEYLMVPGTFTVKCAICAEDTSYNVTCNGSSDGKIIVTMPCEVNPNNYTFKWYKNGGANPVFEGAGALSLLGIGAGTYYYYVFETSNPTINFTSANIVITEPAPWSVTETTTPVTCSSNGEIKLNVSGQNPPYVFSWNPSSIGNTDNPKNLPQGNYSVTISDSKGCSTFTKSFIVGSGIITFSVSDQLIDITCKDADDGEIILSASGGCTPYSVVWSDGLAANSMHRTDLKAGTYKATITDAQGTQIVKDNFTITNPAQSLFVDGEVVEGTTAQILITATGGSGPYTYSWNGPDGFTSTSEDLDNLTVIGDYYVVVTDARGCSTPAKHFQVIGVIPTPTVSVVVTSNYGGKNVKCNGDCNGVIEVNYQANLPISVYLDDELITLVNGKTYSSVCAGVHEIRIVDRLDKEATKTFTITEPDKLVVDVVEVNCETEGEADGSIEVEVSGGVPAYSYNWGITGENGPIIEDLVAGNYAVSVTDANKCTAYSEIIEVENCYTGDCFLGSLIVTPNDDGFNDFFEIQCAGKLSNNYLYLFDRLGNEVFSMSNYDGTWNGLNNDGDELPENGYMWVFTGYDEVGNKQVYKGSVTLLR